MRFTLFQFIALLSFFPAFSQLVEMPVGSQKSSSKSKSAFGSRTESAPRTLPFWDDFSYSDILTTPDTSLWQSGNTVFLNNGIGINQPSKNVVTFDGVDQNGKPYSVNDALAKGFADSLVSKPIRIDLVDPSLRSTVYISFFYQAKGLGEVPDAGDKLVLSFKNISGKWESVYEIQNSDVLLSDTFYQVLIPITDDRFYHNKFQFRIQNFARLSGPYDTWNVDYVYLNVNRFLNDTFYTDRTISSSLSSLFVDYRAMPLKHFLINPAANLKKPSTILYNLKNEDQPFSFSAYATIVNWNGAIPTSKKIKLDSAQNPPSGAVMKALAFTPVSFNTIPGGNDIRLPADYIDITLRFNVLTKDNVPVALPGNPPNGDYVAATYAPIDFRKNDTIRTKFRLGAYYAYDDGGAEYAIKLSQSGSFISFKYLFKSNVPDTLVGVDIYFPEFGDNTAQSLQFEIRTDLSDSRPSIIYQKVIQVERSTQNKFKSFKLDKAIRISGDFYIGWKQLSTASIPVGLDKNTDNGDKMYYNVNGTWVQNTTIKGSMMVRPVFGKDDPGPVTGLEDVVHAPVYPNPTRKICYFPAESEMIVAIDVTGRKLDIELQQMTDRISLTFISPVSGLAIVRYMLKGKSIVEKIMVLAE